MPPSHITSLVVALLLALSLSLAILPTSAETYYLDATGGNDSNSGFNEHEAWATLQKVNAFAYAPGDTVLFKRGERWNGALIPPVSGTGMADITFGSYGEGPLPVIGDRRVFPDGDRSATWHETAPDIWCAPVSKKPYRLWLDTQEYEYAKDAESVNASSRWYYDSAKAQVYIYSRGNPAEYYSAIECLDNECALNVVRKRNMEFQNLNFSFGRISVQILGSQNIRMHDCEIGYGSLVGLYMAGDVASGEESMNNEFYNLYIDSGYQVHNTYFEDLSDGVHFNCGCYRNSLHDFTLVNWGHSALYFLCSNRAFPHGCSYNRAWNFFITAPDLVYGRGLNTDGLEGMTQYNMIFDGEVKDTWTRNQLNGNDNIFRNIIIDTVHNSIRPSKYWGVGEGIGFECYSGLVSHDNTIDGCTIRNTDEAGIYMQGPDTNHHVIKNTILYNCGQASGHGKEGIALNVREEDGIGSNRYSDIVFYQDSGQRDVIVLYQRVMNVSELNNASGIDNRSDIMAGNAYRPPFS
jgi:parallel beta-helix repeat protein